MTTVTEQSYLAPPSVDRIRQRALGVGVVLSAVSLAGLFLDRGQFFRSYLVGFLYLLALPLGCLGIAMLHHVTKGAWGVMVRRILEASARTIPLLALLFIPVILGMKQLFVWTDPEVIAHDELIAGKTAYLNVTFFVVRAVIFFAVWGGLAALLAWLSKRQDETSDPMVSVRMQAVSGVGIALYVITASFASFDWLMSLDPHWFSSIYGLYFVGGQALTALCFVVVVAMILSGSAPMASVYRPSHFHDYAKLMLAFMMLWAYFSLSQFIIIWSGNLPEEVPWYLERTTGPWKLVSLLVVFLHFALPFLLLIQTDIKRNAKRLALVAGLILVMRWVDLYWQAAPALHAERFHWLDVTVPLGLGGLWVALFLTFLRSRPLIPLHEPFLQEALHHE